MNSLSMSIPGGDAHLHIHLHVSSSTPTRPGIVAPDGSPAADYVGLGNLQNTLPSSVATVTAGITATQTISDARSEPIEVQNAIMILRSHFVSEVDAVLLGCFVLQTRDNKPSVFTNEVTDFLRNDIGGYNIPNPASLIRSITRRKISGLKILGKRQEGRHDLEFGLTEEDMIIIRERLSRQS